MLFPWRIEGRGLVALQAEADLAEADWIDLCNPEAEDRARIEALGIHVPTLADMEEIEVSNRLYRENGVEVLTIALPGLDAAKRRITGPVAFLLDERRIVTVRYHVPRSFETFPHHAATSSAGCASHRHLFLGLLEEIVARLADLLEGDGRALDAASRVLFDGPDPTPAALQELLREIGRRGESVATFRHALLTLERALATYALWCGGDGLRVLLKAETRDIQSLIVHADFLSARAAQLTDVTLGMVNLDQTRAGRVLSVVAVLFLPPTLVASIYGMNFAFLPGVALPHGWLIATGLMLGSTVLSILYFRWKGWL